jgi:hypothetical protein
MFAGRPLVGALDDRLQEQVLAGGCILTIEYPNVLRCGVHAACIMHDDCYDRAAGAGWPWGARRGCDEDVRATYGVEKGISWARGRGPYDRYWYFSDGPPRVVRSQPLGESDLSVPGNVG